MIKNSIKLAMRGFFSNPLFSSFNLMSLVIGLSVMFLAISYIDYEESYDSFHENSEQIYRLTRTTRSQDYGVIGFMDWNDSSAEDQLRPIAGLKELRGVADVAQFVLSPASEYVTLNTKTVTTTNILSTNTPQSFLKIFDWQVSAGAKEKFEASENTAIISKTVFEQLFGKEEYNQNDIQQIKIAEADYFLVGIFEDVPENSHFDFKVALHKKKLDYWGSRVYIQTAKGVDYKQLEIELNNSIASINPNLLNDPLYKGHSLQPLESIHLGSNILYELKPPGNSNYMYLIGFFALLISAITLFNYSNFTLAIKAKGSKQIGVKKALGATQMDISKQFLFEGVWLSILALPLVLVLISLCIPSFNELMGTAISLDPIKDLGSLFLLIGLAIGLGLLSSLTPALIIASKSTLDLFEERLSEVGFQSISIRKYLVISQFVMLITISAVCYFVFQQMDFVEHKDLGFNKNGILYAYSSPENQERFQNELRQLPEVKAVGNGSSFAIGTYNNVKYKLDNRKEEFDDANQLYLDYEAVRAYGLETTLSEEQFRPESRIRRVLINQTAANKLGERYSMAPHDLIGKTIVTEPDYTSEDGVVGFPFKVDGIFKDINLFSLKETIGSYFITISDKVRMDGRSIIQYDPNHSKDLIAKIEALHSSLNEPYPLELKFLDANFEALHLQDTRTAKLIFIMNGIALGLAVIGIVGVTLLLLVGRKKEIGIRKVLGANVASLLTMSIKEYIGFIAIALLISWPIAYLITQNWLNNFAYKIKINPLVFIVLPCLIFIFTAVLVAITSYRTAISNPVKSLRTE